MENFQEFLYSKFLQSDGVSIDTRTLEPGNLFFGLRGTNINGSAYAKKALDLGTSFAVIDDPQYEIEGRTILVDDALQTLQQLSVFHRSRFRRKVIGLTGSNGKTTTKELIHRVLSTKYIVHSTWGNFNNHIGVPLTLLGIHPQTEVAIIEMGANHVGEIAQLCTFANPTHGLITNIGRAHTETFGGIEGVLRGKSELFDFLRNSGGVPFINTFDPRLVNMTKRFEHPVQYPSDNVKIGGADPFLHFTMAGQEVTTHLLGAHQFENVAAAVAMGRYFQVEDDQIASAISAYIPDNLRAQFIEKESIKIVLDAYNANPDSMVATLKNFDQLEGRKIAILGDMNELEHPEEEHHRIGRMLKLLAMEAWLVGKHMKHAADVSKDHRWFATKEELTDYLKEQDLQGASVLIKASRSMALETLVESL